MWEATRGRRPNVDRFEGLAVLLDCGCESERIMVHCREKRRLARSEKPGRDALAVKVKRQSMRLILQTMVRDRLRSGCRLLKRAELGDVTLDESRTSDLANVRLGAFLFAAGVLKALEDESARQASGRPDLNDVKRGAGRSEDDGFGC
jgi:hypothetical protein